MARPRRCSTPSDLIETVPETGSTNADLAARLTQGGYVGEGVWLVADRQTAGRGRLGRAWIDGSGNFMGSTVVNVRAGDPSPDTLALVAGLALHEVIAPRLSQAAILKWPNDLLVGGAKLAGILLERTGDAVIVGIGVNLAQAPDLPDRATVALVDLGLVLERDAFAEDLARQFATDLDRWRSYGLGPIVKRWETAGHPVGTVLAADEPDGSHVEGEFAGLTEAGALQLRLADGSVRVMHAGEVRIA
jgi:BirA family transcriptional regulator, biotin operon repressor / biotin---[acetyl-CoA-carboxylase] ligase